MKPQSRRHSLQPREKLSNKKFPSVAAQQKQKSTTVGQQQKHKSIVRQNNHTDIGITNMLQLPMEQLARYIPPLGPPTRH